MAEKALSLNPNCARAAFLRSEALRFQGYLNQAAEAGREALALDPDNPVTHTLLGESLFSAHDFETPRNHFKTALRMDPCDTDAQQGMHIAYERNHWLHQNTAIWAADLFRGSPSNSKHTIVAVAVAVLMISVAAFRHRLSLNPLAYTGIVLIMLIVYAIVLAWCATPLMRMMQYLNPREKGALIHDKILTVRLAFPT